MENQTTSRAGTLPVGELALFCDQIAIALSGGIPLRDAMETLVEGGRDDSADALLAELRDRVLDCGSLADALEPEPGFPRYMTAMIRIGERTGKLDEVMAQLGRYYRWEGEVRQSIKSAVLYPVVLVLMLAVVVAVLLASVLPVFERVFQGLGMEFGSAGAVGLGMTIGRVALIVMALLLVLLAVALLLLRTGARGRVLRLIGRIVPAVGIANERLNDGRFASVIGMMLTAGYQLEPAMELAPSVVADADYRARIERCAAALSAGKGFADAIDGAGLFSDMHRKLIRFGAAAGQLDEVMARVTSDCQSEADAAIAGTVALIEPTLVTVLAVVIGGILLSVMLPLLAVLSSMG